MKPRLVIDITNLAVPAVVAGEDELTSHLDSLNAIGRELRSGSPACEFYMLADASEYLQAAELFPVGPEIRRMLAEMGLTEVFDAEDIRRSIDTIMQRSRSIDQLSGVEFCIPNQSEFLPDFGLLDRLREAVELSFAHVLIAYSGLPKELAGVLLAVAPASRLEVKMEISDIDPAVQGSTQLSLVSEVHTPRTYESFVEGIPLEDLWKYAEAISEMELALSTSAVAFRRQNGCKSPRENCETFTLGSDFNSSLVKWQAAKDGRFSLVTFETCARLIAKMPKNELSEFEEGGKQKIRASDGARAYRTHITSSHQGLRLMFWEKPDGSIELANVGSKHELNIVE